MKRILLATALLIGIGSAASAQTSGSNAGNSSNVNSTAKSKKSKTAKARKAAPDTLNSRKMYDWKDGQRATPTGHEATGTGGGFAAIRKDSATHKDTATAPRDSTKQQ